MAQLARLPRLSYLDIISAEITDDGFARIAALRHLEQLHFWGHRVTGAAVRHLGGLTRLKGLDLAGLPNLEILLLRDTRVGDAGLIALGDAPQLWNMNLAGTNVTDAGIDHLEGWKGLRHLDLSGTQVTPGWLDSLRKTRPDLSVRP